MPWQGSHENEHGLDKRCISFLSKLRADNSPLWLAPDQVRVLTLNDDEALINHAKPIVNELRANMVRVDSDFSATPKAEVIARILAGIRERRA